MLTTEASQHSQGIRILIVDDDEAVGHLIREILARQGWAVTAVQNSAAALEALQSDRGEFHLMIVDLVLAEEMGGLALADLLHRRQPGARFLFISGYADLGVPRETLSGVPKDFIGKPIVATILIDKVRRLLMTLNDRDAE